MVSIIKQAHGKAKAILKSNRRKLDELAAYILEKETITGEEFMTILRRDTAGEGDQAQ